MSSAYTVARSQIVYGLCLPLAVLVGYVLAEPLESSSMFILVLVGSLLSVPVLMRWYHPLTIFSWNAAFYLGFLPGEMPLWFFCALAGFVVILLNRSLDSSRRLMVESGVSWSLVTVAAVVYLTAHFTGGIGMRSLGSEAYGGRKYLYVMGALAGYFVLASRRIPENQTGWYVGVFFLTGLTGFLGDLIYLAGPSFYALYNVIPSGGASYMAEESMNDSGLMRIAGLGATQAGCVYLLARYGMRGILDLGKPWRLALVLLFAAAGLFSGFRSFIIGLGLIFAVAFCLEKLYRTRYMLGVILFGAVLGVVLVFNASRLPISVQRSISFLPVDVNPEVKQMAQATVDWRVEMWEALLPDVSAHLWKGKGYRLDPGELSMADENTSRGNGIGAEGAMMAGDYHNGLLSVLIPFGVWGTLAFGWFLCAVGIMLHRNCVRGDPALLTINRALLACFIGRVIMFLFIFGEFSGDLAWFTGLAGLAVSLNGESKRWEPARLQAPRPEIRFNGQPQRRPARAF